VAELIALPRNADAHDLNDLSSGVIQDLGHLWSLAEA